jgi:hypothetical protein
MCCATDVGILTTRAQHVLMGQRKASTPATVLEKVLLIFEFIDFVITFLKIMGLQEINISIFSYKTNYKTIIYLVAGLIIS